MFQFSSAANAADEVDPFAAAGIVNAKDRAENVFLQQSDVQWFGDIGAHYRGRLEPEDAPLSLKIKADFVLFRWLSRPDGADAQN